MVVCDPPPDMSPTLIPLSIAITPTFNHSFSKACLVVVSAIFCLIGLQYVKRNNPFF